MNQTNFCLQFDSFDPLNGDVPGSPFPELPRIAARARMLVGPRTRQELTSAAMYVDWCINEFAYEANKKSKSRRKSRSVPLEERESLVDHRVLHKYTYRVRQGHEKMFQFVKETTVEQPPPLGDLASIVDRFIACADTYLSDDAEFPEGRDYEYFAVMALWLVADTIELLQWNREKATERLWELLESKDVRVVGHEIITSHALPHKDLTLEDAAEIAESNRSEDWISDDYFRLSKAGHSALLAMDALCYAEHLRAISILRGEKVRQLPDPFSRMAFLELLAKESGHAGITANARKGGVAKGALYASQRAKVISYYEAHKANGRSIDHTAEEILAAKIVNVAYRTVVGWISQHRKSQSAGKL